MPSGSGAWYQSGPATHGGRVDTSPMTARHVRNAISAVIVWPGCSPSGCVHAASGYISTSRLRVSLSSINGMPANVAMRCSPLTSLSLTSRFARGAGAGDHVDAEVHVRGREGREGGWQVVDVGEAVADEEDMAWVLFIVALRRGLGLRGYRCDAERQGENRAPGASTLRR
jgi:hypothetical protein